MKLFTLIQSLENASNKLSYQLLQQACDAQGIELAPVELEKISFDGSAADMVPDGSAWFRLATGKSSELAEQIIVRTELSTVYENWRLPLLGSQLWNDTILMLKSGVPIIKTVLLFSQLKNDQIDDIVESLGGYPVVLKCTGLSHGQGVFLCHSISEITDVINKFNPDQQANLALRKFIPDATHLRVVVVGDEAVDAIKYDKQEGDFRTNAVKTPTAKSIKIGDEIRDLAVKSASVNGVKFAGIDILLDAANQPWVAEVNTPFNYARNYLTNGKNIANDIAKLLGS